MLRLAPLVLLAACAPAPFQVTETAVAEQLARHFDAVYPGSSTGIMRPRFGVPAIAQRGHAFPIVVLQRGSAPITASLVRFDLDDASALACAKGCVPLTLHDVATDRVDATYTRRELSTSSDAQAGTYDLVIGHERVRRAVVLMDEAPRAPRPLRVVQLSDLHFDKPKLRASIDARLGIAIATINRLKPDLVLITGDLAEQGHERAWEEDVGAKLLGVEAPLLVINGNHDYGHWPRLFHPSQPDYGIWNYAHVFHPERFTRTVLGGWTFVGFDSGQSIFSLRILTRGITSETLALLDETIREAPGGVILFTHAPTRAELDSNAAHVGSNRLGSMHANARALEETMLRDATMDKRVLQLAGHTHWSDLFMGKDGTVTRTPYDRLTCPVSIDTPVAIVNAPSSTERTFYNVAHGDSLGFVLLDLDAHEVRARWVLHAHPKTCNTPDDAALVGF